MVPTVQIERVKYTRAWSFPEYRLACHSLNLWENRRDLFPATFASALDLGCGLGLLLAEWNRQGIDAWGIDIAPNCLHESIRESWAHKVKVGCLWEMDWPRRFDFGVSTDVMEHIPRPYVRETLRRTAVACREVLFKIAHEENQFGGDILHLTREQVPWWVEQMEAVMGGEVKFLGTVERSGQLDSLIRWKETPSP